MKIVKCKKISSGRYRVELDNGREMIIYEDVIVKNELLGKEIDASLLIKISEDNTFAEIYNKAIKYIGIRMRSKKEMEHYLEKKQISKNEIATIIKRLEEVGLLNDEIYAKAYINDKLHLSSQGFGKIKKHLLEHDIAEDVIDKLITHTDIDYDERIQKIIKKQMEHHKGKSKFIIRNKIYTYLINLGYDSSDILRNLDVTKVDEETNLEKEYNKLYQKLSKKYSGQELAYQLKRKLYQKGFDYGKVDEYITNKNES